MGRGCAPTAPCSTPPGRGSPPQRTRRLFPTSPLTVPTFWWCGTDFRNGFKGVTCTAPAGARLGRARPRRHSRSRRTRPGQYDPAVVYYGSKYLVVWGDYRNGESDIYGARVNTDGTVPDSAGVGFFDTGPLPLPQRLWPSTASTVLIVWSDLRSGTSYDIYGARWSPTSGLLDSGRPRDLDRGRRPTGSRGGRQRSVPGRVAHRPRECWASTSTGHGSAANGSVTDPQRLRLSAPTPNGRPISGHHQGRRRKLGHRVRPGRGMSTSAR